MTDERYERLMRDAARTYNRAPHEPPLEAMWRVIERAGPRWQSNAKRETSGPPLAAFRPRRRSRHWRPWLQVAAALVLGVALGRGSGSILPGRAAQQFGATRSASTATIDYDRAITDDYLGQAAALLIALPGELQSERVDSSFVWRAGDLLLQTRLLLDSPALSDPALRMLFEDLEVVLVQVVRLDRWDPIKVDLLEQALEQQDVIPRLRNAVVDHFTD